MTLEPRRNVWPILVEFALLPVLYVLGIGPALLILPESAYKIAYRPP